MTQYVFDSDINRLEFHVCFDGLKDRRLLAATLGRDSRSKHDA